MYIPPCLASTLGIHFIHDTQQQQNNVVSNSISIAYLQPLPKNEIVKASHVTIREIGCLPPVPNLICPLIDDDDTINGSNNVQGDSSKDGVNVSANNEQVASMEEIALRKFFLYPPSPSPNAIFSKILV